jgi:hypothetical protein
MLDKNFARFSRTLALTTALGLGAGLPGCADIHPEPNDPDLGMEDSSNEGAVHERDEEAESEGTRPGEGRPR